MEISASDKISQVKSWQLALVFALIALSIGFFKSFYFLSKVVSDDSQAFWTNLLQVTFANGVVISLLSVFAVVSTSWFLKKGLQPLLTLLLHAIGSVITGALAYFFMLMVSRLVFPTGSMTIHFNINDHLDQILASSDMTFLYYSALVGMIYLLALNQQFRDVKLKNALAEKDLVTSRLQQLKARLEPHFMFNALNTISSLTLDNPQKANLLISQLADLLRTTVKYAEQEFVSIASEAEYLEQYLKIMKSRYEDNLHFDIAIDPAVAEKMIATGLLQPLVENAIKHGMKGEHEPLSVKIVFSGYQRIEVRVFNNGTPLEEKIRNESGGGLSMVRDRLNLIYGEAVLQLENTNEPGFTVCASLELDEVVWA